MVFSARGESTISPTQNPIRLFPYEPLTVLRYEADMMVATTPAELHRRSALVGHPIDFARARRSGDLADDLSNLFRDCVMDHMSGPGYLGKRAPVHFSLQATGLPIEINNPAARTRHDCDGHRQFGIALVQVRCRRN